MYKGGNRVEDTRGCGALWSPTAAMEKRTAHARHGVWVIALGLEACKHLGDGTGKGVRGCKDVAKAVELGMDSIIFSPAGCAGGEMLVLGAGDVGELSVFTFVI